MLRGIILIAFASIGFAQQQRTAPSDSARMNELGAFIGKWESSAKMFDTKYSHAQSLSSEMVCEWAPNRRFLISDQIIKSAHGNSDQLGVFGYDSQSKEFYSYAFSEMRGSPYISHPVIDGNVWTYSGEFNGPDGSVKTRTTNTFVGRDTVRFESEYSEDGTHWVVMMRGTDIRLK